jgi:FkbM family methyltransferase
MRLPLNDAAVTLVREIMTNPDYQYCNAQFGEDLILEILFAHKPSGFYVDAGAHHPTRLSNTNLLFRRGWKGINIDLDPRAKEEFDRARPNDINLTYAIYDESKDIEVHFFDERAVNTISDEAAIRYGEAGWHRERTEQVRTVTLATVLDAHLPPSTTIDLLNVDVEGVDLNVLRSNDWNRYRPTVVLVEVGELDFMAATTSGCMAFMHEVGYRLASLCHITGIFIEGQVN